MRWRPAAVAFAYAAARRPRRRAHPLHRFLINATLGTARFDASYRAKHTLPNLDNYWYIDIVCSKTKPRPRCPSSRREIKSSN